MVIARALGVLFLLLSLYYPRLLAIRQEPLTVVQMATLLCAAAFLFLQSRSERPNPIWFRGWRPVAWQGWAVVLGGGALMLAVFLILDRDSHSVSDTLHRIVPIYSLLAALTVELRYERTEVLVR